MRTSCLVAGTLAVLLGLAYVLATPGREAGQLQRLPDEARGALYQRTLEETASLCRLPAAASGVVHDHCVAQARFVLMFPECDRECRLAAGSVLPHARR